MKLILFLIKKFSVSFPCRRESRFRHWTPAFARVTMRVRKLIGYDTKLIPGFTPTPTFKKVCSSVLCYVSFNKFKQQLYHSRKLVKGFTMIEVMLSIAFLAIIFGMAAPYYRSFQVRNDLDIATETIVQSLRRAQVLSQAQDGDMNWGVYVQAGSIIIFKGVSYVLRDASYDETSNLPASIASSGIAEVVFSKLYGLPQSIGTFTLTSTANETRNITINEKGMVNF